MEWNQFEREEPEYRRFVVLYDEDFKKKYLGRFMPSDGISWMGDHWVTESGEKRFPRTKDKWVYVDIPGVQ